MPEKDSYLGVEFGSTRIKAVAIDSGRLPVASGDYIWAARHGGRRSPPSRAAIGSPRWASRP